MQTIKKPVLVIIHGGGCRQIEAATGMLKALDEAKITIDLYRGASAGAIAAALHASGLPGKRIEALIRLTPVNRLFAKSWWKMFKLLIPGVKCDSFYSTEGLYIFLKINMSPLLCLQKALVSVTRYPQYECELMPATIDAVMASSAIPEVFPPVDLDGQLYVDGGVLNNVPTPHIHDIASYAHIFILLCPQDSSDRAEPWTKIGRCLKAVDETMDREAQEITDTWADLDNVTILQPPPHPSSLLDWSTDYSLIKHAYQYAKAELTNNLGAL